VCQITRQLPLEHFKKLKVRKVKQVLSVSRYQWEGGALKERVKEGEYEGYVLYTCVKIEQ
jgi:hypothetical protein